MLRFNHPRYFARHSPSITTILILISLVVYLSSLNASESYIQNLTRDLSFIPHRDFRFSFNFIFHAVSYQFIHAGFRHFLFNMLALWIFGTAIEACFGRQNFLLFYLSGGIIAVIAQNLFDGGDPYIPIVGASGSIAAVMAAYLLLFGRTRLWVLLIFIPVRMPAFMLILIWVALNIFWVASGSEENIAFWAHLGGFTFGLVACFFLKPASMNFLQKL